MKRYLGLFLYWVALLATPLQTAVSAEPEQPTSTYVFEYDASAGFLDAGTLTLELTEFKDKYEILGRFKSSRALSKYYTWNGLFAAKGHWQKGARQTDSYFVRSEGSDDRLILHCAQNSCLFAEHPFASALWLRTTHSMCSTYSVRGRT